MRPPRTRANSAPRVHSVADRVCGSVREANNHTLHSETGLRIAHRATDLLRPGEFSNVVDYDVRNGCRIVGIGCDASGASNKACLAKDILTRMSELAQGGAGIAVAFRLGSSDRPFVYGHIYALVMGFAQALGFAQAAATPSVVPLYLHHSASLGSFRVVQTFMAKARKTASNSMFAEVVALFTEAVGVKIKLRPWVPHCGPLASPRTITCVMGRNGVPETLRGRVSLLLNVPSANSMARPPARHLRHIVAHSLGLSREPQNVALLVATGRASNGRTIANEDEVQSAIRAYFADAAPLHSLKQRLSFVHQDVQSLPLVEEARLFRRARLVVALFGSTFWNCLFMERPAVAVQIHGALKDDVDAGAAYGWCALCALNCGVGWIPLSVEGAMPRWKNCSTIGRVPQSPPTCTGASAVTEPRACIGNRIASPRSSTSPLFWIRWVWLCVVIRSSTTRSSKPSRATCSATPTPGSTSESISGRSLPRIASVGALRVSAHLVSGVGSRCDIRQ